MRKYEGSIRGAVFCGTEGEIDSNTEASWSRKYENGDEGKEATIARTPAGCSTSVARDHPLSPISQAGLLTNAGKANQ